MRMTKPCLLGLLMLAPAVHAAEAYKCVDANGNTMLTDVPCHTLTTRPVPPPAGQARPPETLKQPKPEPILPPPEQRLPSPPAPLPASPHTAPLEPRPQMPR